MYVGVNREEIYEAGADASIPHVCGGEPVPVEYLKVDEVYSPCMWG